MANLKEVRIRISSVNTTMQITKAMKLVAASKLKRAQDRITQMRPYSEKLNYILSNIMGALKGESLSLAVNQVREPKNILVVLITSDKGLCGGFNSNLIKTASRLVTETYSQQLKAGNLSMLYVGKKGYDVFKKVKEVNHIQDYQNIMHGLTFEKSQEVSSKLTAEFLDQKWDRVELIYAKFVNAATQHFMTERYLPVEQQEVVGEPTKVKNDYIFQPDKQLLLEELAPKILNTQFFKALLDTNASEHGARMVAMESATNNANDLIKALKIQYNRERQAAITKEILEIVGGAAALEENG